MRILFIINSLGLGGTERQITHLVSGMRKKNVTVSIIYFQSNHHYSTLLKNTGAEVQYIDITKMSKFRGILKVIITSVKKVKAFKPQIIQGFTPTSNTIAALSGIITGTAIVLSERNVNITMSIVARIARIFIYRTAKIIICNAQEVANWCQHYYMLNDNKLAVIQNGVTLPDLTANTISNRSEVKKILTIASFKPQKGYKYLIQSVPKVLQGCKTARFIFVGEGAERKKMEKMAKDLKIEDVIIFNNATEQTERFYRDADIFCLPSISEGMPNAVMEAMSYRLPIVATNAGGTSVLIRNEDTGLLVSPMAPGELSAALLDLINDHAKRIRLSFAARKHIANFELSKYINNYMGLYEKIIKSTR